MFCSITFVTASVAYLERNTSAALDRLVAMLNDPGMRKFKGQLSRDGMIPPKTMQVTVLFTDICGFSEIVAKMPGAELMPWLNEYMARMSKIVEKNNGFVNKFIGDSIMAVFGASIARETVEARPEDARMAVLSALQMRDELDRVNTEWELRDQPRVEMRVGIFSG